MTNYPVGDFLVRIKNIAMARQRKVTCPSSRVIKEVAKVLKNEGFLDDLSEKNKKLTVRLTYRRKEPVLMDIKLVSKPGMRVYVNADEIESKKDVSIYILSTPKGIVSSREAVKKHIGGELIAKIF